jgi:dolichyl-phosphate-mannose-protein mannosyltransferase
LSAYDRWVTQLSATELADDAGDAGDADSLQTFQVAAGDLGVKRDVPAIVRRRLDPKMPDDTVLSWVGTLLVTVIAGVLRFMNLGHPPGKIFDEIYYATEGHDLLVHGIEWNAANNTGDFVVHPPLGKWLIGFGEWMFKYNEFGWRFMPAVVGTLSVLILIRTTRRMFRSTALGLAAGLLMTLDGMEFVLSRTSLLDIFLMFFLLAAFACLVLDRDARRRRWLRAMENGLDPTLPSRAGRPKTPLKESIPWWRLAAAVMTGCAMSVKWSALWFIILFALLIFLWEYGLRRAVGAPHPIRDTLLDEIGWIALCGVVLVGVYLASWTGWFVTDHGYDRHWLASTGHHEYPIIGALQNLIHYHGEALHFHDNLTAKHQYQSWPWQWLLLGRPVAFYYSSAGGCGAANCSAEVLLLGTPLLWWSFIPALVGTVAFGVSRRDWRAFAIFGGAFAGIVPWFPYELDDRTMFYFYAAPALPFLIMGVVYVFGAIMKGPVGNVAAAAGGGIRRGISRAYARDPRLFYGGLAFAAYLLLIAWCFSYFHPIYVGEKITYAQWFARMWLGNRWI